MTSVRIPVMIVTGYLGSGKTTLIARLLEAPDMAGTAVIVNELAEIGIDQSVLADVGQGEVVLLSNGCLCCGRGTDLANTVRGLIAGRPGAPRIERILIETSGAADPAPILRQVCFDPALRSSLRYGGTLCLFDAALGTGLLKCDPVGYRQIALADMIVVTKTDLVEKTQSDGCIDLLRTINSNAVIASDKEQAMAFLRGNGKVIGTAGSQSWLGAIAQTGAKSHPVAIGTWTVRIGGAIDWARAEQALRAIYDRYGDAMLRTKGLVWTVGDARPMVIHGINRHFHRPIRLKSWENQPCTTIVVIGFESAERAAEEMSRILKGYVADGKCDAAYAVQ